MITRKFEWNSTKAATNVAKHDLSFDEASHAFDDPFALIAPAKQHSAPGEDRYWLIGQADKKAIVVVFTLRNNDEVTRIISARPASKNERALYEASKRISFP